ITSTCTTLKAIGIGWTTPGPRPGLECKAEATPTTNCAEILPNKSPKEPAMAMDNSVKALSVLLEYKKTELHSQLQYIASTCQQSQHPLDSSEEEESDNEDGDLDAAGE
ncbi:hypothetical protein C0989_010475, partial [Termitomyces sp. Mn162]